MTGVAPGYKQEDEAMLSKTGVAITWKTLFYGVVGVLACIGAFSIVQAQQRGNRPAALTAADRLEIQELLHRYMFVLDSCPDHGNGYEYADLYTEDGEFHSQDIQFGMKVNGRKALAELAAGATDGSCGPIRRRGATNQVHLNLAPILEPSAEGARGISYLLMIDGPRGDLLERLSTWDVYAKTQKAGASSRGCTSVAARSASRPICRRLSGLWGREPTAAGGRSLVGRVTTRGPVAGDPLKWLMSSQTR
jgi:hypothetical protein